MLLSVTTFETGWAERRTSAEEEEVITTRLEEPWREAPKVKLFEIEI